MNHISKILIILVAILILNLAVLATVLHVPEDFEVINTAVEFAELRDTILINDGSYTESIQISASALTIASHYLLDGDTTHILETNITGLVNIPAFTLTRGNEYNFVGIGLINCNLGIDMGGSAVSAYSCNTSFNFCRFIDNRAAGAGALFLQDGQSHFTDCVFIGNSARNDGGAITIDRHQTVFDNCTFLQNSAEGSGACIAAFASSGTIKGCSFLTNFAQNSASTIGLYLTGSWLFEYNQFRGNTTSFGTISISGSSNVIVQNCVFENNECVHEFVPTAAAGIDFISIENSALVIENNFRYNSVTGAGCALSLGPGDYEINSNIMEGNTARNSVVTSIGGEENICSVRMNWNRIRNTNRDLITDLYAGVKAGNHSAIHLDRNDFINNDVGAGTNRLANGTLNIGMNYWGHESGPFHEILNPGGLGDTILVANHFENWSLTPVTNFQLPEEFSLLQPANGSDHPTPVSFQWEETTDPNEGDSLRFWVEISTDPEFDPDVTRKWKLGTSDHLDSLRLGVGRYYWRVRCLDPLWLETLSRESWTFEVTEAPTRPDPPTPFNLISPEDGAALTDSIISFAWENSSIPNGLGDVVFTLILNGGDDLQDYWTFEVGNDTTLEIAVPQWEALTLWYVAAVNDSADTTFSNQIFTFF
ncbi:hypothetical protein K8I28_01865, partial [bacterium]|nr:hypothetical protein [bacterium]